MLRTLRWAWRLCLALALLVLALAPGALHAQSGPAPVVLVRITDLIDDVNAGYLKRGVERAQARGAQILVIELNTPGGLLSSTETMVSSLLNARVPTVAYVSPQGAHAASAGTFIGAAAHFLVMSPVSRIGAASPVGGSGEDLPSTLKSKVTEDAAALMRNIATARHRNVAALEATVTSAKAYDANEAVSIGIADFIAPDLTALLARLDGKQVLLPNDVSVVLHTAGAPVETVSHTALESFLKFLADPNLVFILLVIGGLGILIELFGPGHIVPGVVGAICLILAFVGIGNLPVNWAGIALLGVATVLAFIEAQHPGLIFPLVAAIVSFVLGAFLLFSNFGAPSPTLPSVRIHPGLIIGLAVFFAAVVVLYLTAIVRGRKIMVPTASEALAGQVGYAASDLSPRGTVQVAGELWSAIAENTEPIKSGQAVKVLAVDGLTLKVAKATDS